MMVTGAIYICMNLSKALRDRWVQAQLVLLLLLGASGPILPRYAGLGPLDPLLARTDPWPFRLVGLAVCLLGLAFAAWAARTLGAALTPEPEPLPDVSLVVSGPYGIVRHPIYTGVVLALTGWTLAWSNWTLALVAGVLIACFFEAKARVEERWLRSRFPGYAEYARRVRRRVLTLTLTLTLALALAIP
jgi:protein-S-isoprenylcysteine O-methyltransferase Ste14